MRKMIVDKTIIQFDYSTAHFSQISLAGNKSRQVHTIISAMPIMIVLHPELDKMQNSGKKRITRHQIFQEIHQQIRSPELMDVD